MEYKENKNALKDYIDMICKSWTYAKMTDSEKKELLELLQNHSAIHEGLKGSYTQRYKILNIFYIGYLGGLGYKDGNFRENKEVI